MTTTMAIRHKSAVVVLISGPGVDDVGMRAMDIRHAPAGRALARGLLASNRNPGALPELEDYRLSVCPFASMRAW